MGAELTDATIPAEAGQWLIDSSVSFTKGCYTGQELVARIDSRGGNVPRPLRGLRVDGGPPAIGSVVERDGDQVGQVTSSATSAVLGAVALAPISRTVEVGSEVSVRAADGGAQTAIVTELPMR
jgi:folate-binding protein YgfZ